MLRDEREQIRSRHEAAHFTEQDLLARAPVAEIAAEVCLIHAATEGNLRASIQGAGMVT